MYNFTEELEIGPDHNRVSATIYSHYGRVDFGLDRYSNKTALLRAISNIPYIFVNVLTQQMDCAKL